MSFNSLMTLLVRSLVDLLDDNPSVIELGNQTFKPGDTALKTVIRRSEAHTRIDRDSLKKLLRLTAEERRDKTAEYYRCLGFVEYRAIDANEKYGSLVMDLNKDLKNDYRFTNVYDLVTNNGTGEHIFNQAAVFQNMHNMTAKNGIMVHVMPFLNYINHGFYSFHPNLYFALTGVNHYRLIALGVAHRGGYGVIAEPDHTTEALGPCLLEERRIALSTLLEEAKFGGKGLFGSLNGRRRFFLKLVKGNRLNDIVNALVRRYGRILVFAAMRKLEDKAFQFPFQTIYTDTISDVRIRREYGV